MSRTTTILFSTGCTAYFDWQSLGLAYSVQHSWTDAEPLVVRLMSRCVDEASRSRSSDLPHMTTFEHPDFAEAETSGVPDAYAPYNKPGGVLHWLKHSAAADKSEFILLLESDMLLRGPIDCAAMGVRPGRAASAPYDYLRGASNGMARGFIKNVHRVQAVGGWVCVHRDDLRTLAPVWLDLTKQVRMNPGRYWRLPGQIDSVKEDIDTGDAYATRGHAPFISDMHAARSSHTRGAQVAGPIGRIYLLRGPAPPPRTQFAHGACSCRYGYIFAAAEVSLSHLEHPEVMLYAGHAPSIAMPPPSILHYGLWCEVSAPGLASPWRFNKLSFTGGHAGGFSPHACLHYFPAPPLPSELIAARLEREQVGSALLCAEVGVRLNAALCEYHHVSPDEQGGSGRVPPCVAAGATKAEALCPAPSLVEFLYAEKEADAIGTPSRCVDGDARCADWAASAARSSAHTQQRPVLTPRAHAARL